LFTFLLERRGTSYDALALQCRSQTMDRALRLQGGETGESDGSLIGSAFSQRDSFVFVLALHAIIK
jgi:hypothetical protein